MSIETQVGAGEALSMAAAAAVGRVGGISGVHDLAPIQASVPFAIVEIGPEADWGHKSGEGREVRLAVTIRDEGERPTRLRRLVRQAEVEMARIDGILEPGPAGAGWRVVTMRFLRSRLVREGRTSLASAGSGPGRSWAGVVEFRARLLEYTP